MRILLITLTIFICSNNLFAAIKWNSAYQNYIDKYKYTAIEQMNLYHIPASITLAQGLLESGAGLSRLATQANNHFGIKCHNGWNGRTIYIDDDKKNDCFRVYSNANESFIDHSKFLQSNRYKALFSLKTTDYKGWAKGLKACGYATNPQYAERLIEIIELYNLSQYDTKNFVINNSQKKKKKKEETKVPTIKHIVYTYNNNYYVLAEQGETFRSISKDVGVSQRALAKYNERDINTVLSKGDIVYLEKKATKADIKYKGFLHIVRPGQSMYDISQMYGIRLSCLYKINNLPNDYWPTVGDKLRVY